MLGRTIPIVYSTWRPLLVNALVQVVLVRTNTLALLETPRCSCTQEALVLNNYWPQPADSSSMPSTTSFQGALGSPMHQKLLVEFAGRTDFCIPIISHIDMAYDIQSKPTPEMAAGAGYNRFGEAEPRWREVHPLVGKTSFTHHSEGPTAEISLHMLTDLVFDSSWQW